jgi:CRP/FNR family transcriptional regulator
MNDDERRQFEPILRRNRWFASLDDALRHRIIATASIRRYGRGRSFQVENEPVPGLLCVLEGRVLLLKHVGGDKPAVLHLAGAGLWLGEGALLGDDRGFVTAVAKSSVTAMLIPRLIARRWARTDEAFQHALLRMLLDRYAMITRFLAESATISAERRLQLRLADFVELQRIQIADETMHTELNLTQQELADALGVSRQKVNGWLRKLRDDGLVELDRPGVIRVLDAERLRESAIQLD